MAYYIWILSFSSVSQRTFNTLFLVRFRWLSVIEKNNPEHLCKCNRHSTKRCVLTQINAFLYCNHVFLTCFSVKSGQKGTYWKKSDEVTVTSAEVLCFAMIAFRFNPPETVNGYGWASWNLIWSDSVSTVHHRVSVYDLIFQARPNNL